MLGFIILIVVTQILVEMVPVSSTGHVFLMQKIALKSGYITTPFQMPEWFEYCLNLPSLLVLGLFFRKSFMALIVRSIRLKTRWVLRHSLRFSERVWLQLSCKLILYVIAADLVTAIPYFAYKTYSVAAPSCLQHMLGFLLTGCALISLRFIPHSPAASLTLSRALLLGLIQGLAKVCSYSRFGSTFVAGRWLGLSPRRSMEVSFLMYAPLLFASGVKGLITAPWGDMFTHNLCNIWFFGALVGATIASYYVFCAVYRAAMQGTLWRLGFYMLIPALLMLFL